MFLKLFKKLAAHVLLGQKPDKTLLLVFEILLKLLLHGVEIYSIMLKGAAESYCLTFFPAKLTDGTINA